MTHRLPSLIVDLICIATPAIESPLYTLHFLSPRLVLPETVATEMTAEGSKDLPVRPAEAKPAKADAKQSNTDALPDFIVERNNFFEELWQKHLEETKNKPHPDINITVDLGNGTTSTVTAKAWETTPAKLLKDLPKELGASAVIGKVDGELYDLSRVLERDCTVAYVPFDDPEGREVFWHSSAHCLGEACECQYGCLLSHGPPTPQGFFYDMAMPDGYVVNKSAYNTPFCLRCSD